VDAVKGASSSTIDGDCVSLGYRIILTTLRSLTISEELYDR
jgi:hypothetical protein